MPAFSISSGLSVTPSASAVGFPASFFSAAGDGACGADGACWHPANSRKVTHDTVSPGALERAFALIDVAPLEFFDGPEVLQGRERFLHVDQRGDDRCTVGCQQLAFAGQRLISLRAQFPVIENRLGEVRRSREGGAGS